MRWCTTPFEIGSCSLVEATPTLRADQSSLATPGSGTRRHGRVSLCLALACAATLQWLTIPCIGRQSSSEVTSREVATGRLGRGMEVAGRWSQTVHPRIECLHGWPGLSPIRRSSCSAETRITRWTAARGLERHFLASCRFGRSARPYGARSRLGCRCKRDGPLRRIEQKRRAWGYLDLSFGQVVRLVESVEWTPRQWPRRG